MKVEPLRKDTAQPAGALPGLEIGLVQHPWDVINSVLTPTNRPPPSFFLLLCLSFVNTFPFSGFKSFGRSFTKDLEVFCR